MCSMKYRKNDGFFPRRATFLETGDFTVNFTGWITWEVWWSFCNNWKIYVLLKSSKFQGKLFITLIPKFKTFFSVYFPLIPLKLNIFWIGHVRLSGKIWKKWVKLITSKDTTIFHNANISSFSFVLKFFIHNAHYIYVNACYVFGPLFKKEELKTF